MIKRIVKTLFCHHVWEWSYEVVWSKPDEEKICLGCRCQKCGWPKEITFIRKKLDS